ncbi:MAG: FAD-dependent oxidoreductase [Oscillospiraceae bacterium]|nr:FAD-dependent oxidoreductase [Oscillospiraceae bacterium]
MESIWPETTALPTFDSLKQDLKTDVLIIGGGLAGILCAYMLDKAGVDYALVEADRICNGVTRNTTAKITSQHGLIFQKLIREFGVEKARMYLEANEKALKDYRQICRDIPCDLEEKDAYVYSVDRLDKLEKELAALEQIGHPAEFVRNLPLPFFVAGGIQFRNQAQFNPLKFVQGIVQKLNIYENTRAKAFDGKYVVTERANITASKIIVATHFPFINKHGSYFLKLYQHRSYVLGLDQGPMVDGMYIDENKHGLSFRNYQDLLLIGGGSHRTGKQGGNWTELEAFAQAHYPGARIKYRWATQDCMTLDGIPYIGQYSKSTPDLYVATGFNKWGITSSMVAATLLCDLIQGRDNPYASVFSPSRTMLRPQLLYNGIEAAANLLTISKRRCPHMGCALKWNPQERTWDCPCHGSRFTEEGKLLDNPATDDMTNN